VFIADIFKFVGAKVASAIIGLAAVGAGYWCWQNPEALKAFGAVVKFTLLWLLIAAALPWTSYVFMRPLLSFQASRQSASAAALASLAVIAGFWLIDVCLAFYFAGGLFVGTLTWVVVILGFIAAAAYNYVICESLARHVER
jgi:hypothetical protein